MNEDLQVLLLCLGVPTALIITSAIIIYREDVWTAIKTPFTKYKAEKQNNCFHHWSRMDADYNRDETLYRYRCYKCKAEKRLWDSQKDRFEKDFMSDWD